MQKIVKTQRYRITHSPDLVQVCLRYCWSTCTKSGEWVVLYICVWGIVEVPVLSQESDPVYLCLRYCWSTCTKSGECSNTDIQDHSLSWLSTGTSTIPQTQIYRITLLTYYRYFNNTPNTDIQDHSFSWSTCTKSGEWVILYICVWGIVEVPVISQESEWSCISVFGVWLSTGTSTIPQTQIYRITHSPDLVQVLQQYPKHRYTGSLKYLY
jgi:hypothetical protein